MSEIPEIQPRSGPAPVAPVPAELPPEEESSGAPQTLLAVRLGPAPLPQVDDPEDFVRRALSERAALRSVGAEVLSTNEPAKGLPDFALPGEGELRPAEEPAHAPPHLKVRSPEREPELRVVPERDTEALERDALALPLGTDDQQTQSAVAPQAGGLSHAERDAQGRSDPVPDEHLIPTEETARDAFTQDSTVEAASDDPLVTRFMQAG